MFKKKTFSSVPTECTPNQLETLAKLRLRIREARYPEATFDDEYLLRFLCARKFDLEKTLQMWKNFIDWRNGHNIDKVMSMEFPDMTAAKPYYPHTWFRTDKQGRPIFIECMGKLKLDEMLRVIPLERVELYFIRDFERLLKEKLPACSAAAGHPVHNTCYIMDLKGASSSFMSPKVWEMLKIASKIGQDYYPETLGDMFVINAPMFVYGAWNIVKHLMDEKTRSKIHILGSNYKNELLKYIDEENLPDFLGGKVPEAEYGPNLLNEQGPWVKPVVKQSPVEEKKQLNVVSVTVEKKSIMVAKVEEKVNTCKTPAKSPMSKFEVEDFEELEIPQECAIKSLKMRPSLMFTGIEAIRCGK